jgi:opacity protein-like surface antigen
MPAVARFGAPLLLLGLLLAPRAASAGTPTFFVLELSTGIAEAAYSPGDPGLAYGLAAGLSFKLHDFPLRFYFLTGLSGRQARSIGAIEGTSAFATRRDLDLYLSHRIGLPIFGPLRLYGEIGIGRRWVDERVSRGDGLGDLPAAWNETVLALALGLEARISDLFSVGLRTEMTPFGSDVDLVTASTGAQLTRNRVALLGQIGIHF